MGTSYCLNGTIKNSKNCLVLCDGGNKIDEFNLFSNHLKTNDVIMAHDFALNKDVFDKNIKGKVWDYLECSQSQIEGSIKRNNLAP